MENEKYLVVEELVSFENIELYRQKKVVEFVQEGETLLEMGMVERAERYFKRAANYEDMSQRLLAAMLLSDSVTELLYDEKVAAKNGN